MTSIDMKPVTDGRDLRVVVTADGSGIGWTLAERFKIRRPPEKLSPEAAAPTQARGILQAEGAHKVAFHG